MLYIYPEYYPEFHCTADACEDTCCAGWQIAADEKALRRYYREGGSYKKKLRTAINWKQKTFRQDRDKRCAFLREDNLCDMYLNLGPDSLCRTCRLYPRHIEEFEEVREISLSVSCPEVARMLVARKEPVNFLTIEKEGTEEYEEFDPFLYSKLLDARTLLFEILQNRSLPIENRMIMSLGLAYDMENRVGRGRLFACDEVFETYRKQTWFSAAGNKADRLRKDIERRYACSREMFGNLRELELLREDWANQLDEAELLLFAYGVQGYRKIHTEFDEWIWRQKMETGKTELQETGNLPDWDIFCEQLMVYFIFTYFCGAVYDGEIFVNVEMAVASVFIIWELMTVRWLKNEKTLDAEDAKEVVYRYSRELEHSDENKKRFWKCLKKQREWFC